ncbi:MAG: hypothetical protein NTW96_23790 [Planctomycetia bacterium]|nr:hypothetical protein [Planctomycetia bacterium]
MASPFTVFRKHQKVLIAVAGLMAMIAFVFLPMVLQSMGHRGAAANPVVVSTKQCGNLKDSDLYRMRGRRQRLLRFLETALQSTGEDRMIVVAKWRQLRQMIGDTSERETVNRWLMARHAQQMGMTVGDEVINDFLQGWTDNRLGKEQFARLYKQASTSEEEVFNTLHDELLANEAMRMFWTSVVATSPGQRWDYYQRLNRRVSVETAPVAVEQFVSQIAEPSEAQLKEFFEQYKGNYASPESPEPGFRVPRKVAIQYVKADYAKFTDPQAVTDEQIEAYYKENRDRDYQNFELPGLDDTTLPPLDAAPKPGASAEKPAPPSESPKTPEAAQPKAEEPKKPEAVEPKPEEPKKPEAAEPKPPTNEKPAPSEQKEEAKKDVAPKEPAGDAKGEEAPKKSSSVRRATPARLVSMEQADTSQEDAAKKDEPKKDEAEKAPAEPAKEPEKAKPDEKPKLELPALPPSLPGLETKPPSEADAGKTPQEVKTPTPPTPPPAQSAEPKPKYKPLAEVQDEIRRILARKKADERIMAVLSPIQSKMSKFRSELILWNTKEEDQKSAKPELGLAALAQAGNLSFYETPLASALEVSGLDIGKSRVEGQEEFLRVIFEAQPEYQPGISQDSDQNYYLFWKTAETEEKVSNFDDEGVRDEVLAAWKRVQARELALKKASQLAEQARRGGKSLEAAIGKEPGIVVSKDGPFSWLTGGTVPTTMHRDPLRISRVDHVELAGNDFMRTVYGLKVGEIGVAMNQPKTVAYVVQLKETTPSDSVLWQMFKADDYSKYASVASGDESAMYRAWLDGLHKAAGLKWEREADQRQAP